MVVRVRKRCQEPFLILPLINNGFWHLIFPDQQRFPAPYLPLPNKCGKGARNRF